MGISHPLSDEFYGGPRGGGLGSALLLSPSSPPPPASCCSPVDDGQEDFLQHQVSRMDTLAGIAIKYGVEVTSPSLPSLIVSALWCGPL